MTNSDLRLSAGIEDGPDTPDEALDYLIVEAGWPDLHGGGHHDDDCPICRSIAMLRAGLNHAYPPTNAHIPAPAQPSKELIAAQVLLAMSDKVGSDTYGVSYALKINKGRAEKAAESILSLLAAQPPAAPVATDAVEGKLDTIVQLIHKHVGIRQRIDVDLTGVEDAAKAILAASHSRSSAGNGDLAARAAELLSVKDGWGTGPALEAMAEKIGGVCADVGAQNRTIREALELAARIGGEPQAVSLNAFEECAKIADSRANGVSTPNARSACEGIAAAIRSRASAVSRPERACTCHPDEALVPCQKKYAFSECQRAANDQGKEK